VDFGTRRGERVALLHVPSGEALFVNPFHAGRLRAVLGRVTDPPAFGTEPLSDG
jgi:hypothetical protein